MPWCDIFLCYCLVMASLVLGNICPCLFIICCASLIVYLIYIYISYLNTLVLQCT